MNASRCLAFNPDPEDVSKYEALQRGDEGFVQDNKYLTLGMINDRPFGKCGRDSAVNPGITITLNSYYQKCSVNLRISVTLLSGILGYQNSIPGSSIIT